MTRATLLAFLRDHRYAAAASVDQDGAPQAAVVGIAVLDSFALVFDTLDNSRKGRNLARDPRVAFVIGGLREGEEQTVQYEGEATRPAAAELESIQQHYFQVFPDGRDRLAWPGLTHLLVRPRWLRYSDYRKDPPVIVELTAQELLTLT